jgi:hypothetical protein
MKLEEIQEILKLVEAENRVNSAAQSFWTKSEYISVDS